MPVSADVLRTHVAYTAWASRRLVEAAAQLAPEELTRDFQTADHSVLGTLVHTFQADRVWLVRVTGAPITPRFRDGSDEDYHLSVLQTDWPELLGRWQQFTDGLTDETAQAIVSYQTRAGTPFSQPLWEIVLHVVNHGTHHRGQVSGFLRSMGHTPPVLDLLYFQRERAAHA